MCYEHFFFQDKKTALNIWHLDLKINNNIVSIITVDWNSKNKGQIVTVTMIKGGEGLKVCLMMTGTSVFT